MKLDVKQKVILLILCILTIVLCVMMWAENITYLAQNFNNEFVCDTTSGFYSEAIIVRYSKPEGAEIYYTLDGSEPTKVNTNAFKYEEEGIYFPCGEEERVYTLKAAVCDVEGIESSIVNRTYIIGQNIETRYDLLVLSVSGNPSEFYNYEDGIMVHGKLDDEYRAANPEWADFFNNKQIPIFGNYYQTGRESEKPVYVALFNQNGEIILEQNAGFRLYGAISRMKNQPSFRLYARSEYDEQNELEYVFFDNQYSNNTLVNKFKRIIVRNSGNDNGYGFIRSELTSNIALDAGFPDAQGASPVCVYLNGEYYGVHWFVTNFDDEYFRQKYGEYTGEMYIMEGATNEIVVSEDEDDDVYISLVKEYNEKQNFFATCDLTVEKNWEALNRFIDVDNFLQYLAIQHYTGNSDTLLNNYRIYRYYATDGLYTADTVFDGRYRFLLFDMDYSLGLSQQYDYREPEKELLTAERVNGTEEYYKLFKNLMSREECKQIYIRYYLSCMNHYYSEENVTDVLAEMHASRLQELRYVYNNTSLLQNNFKAPDVAGDEYIEAEMHLIRRFANKRPVYGITDLSEAFGGITPYTLHITNEMEAAIGIDCVTMHDRQFSGTYISEVSTQLCVYAQKGYRFAHWTVNGEIYKESVLKITPDMIQNDEVNVKCVCVPDDNASLCISAIKSKGGMDYVELTNISQNDIALNEFYLTDSGGVGKSTLPAIVLAPQESIIIYCKNYTGIEALGAPGANFNISTGENVALYNIKDECIHSVLVPDLGSKDGVYTLDLHIGQFKEVLP